MHGAFQLWGPCSCMRQCLPSAVDSFIPSRDQGPMGNDTGWRFVTPLESMQTKHKIRASLYHLFSFKGWKSLPNIRTHSHILKGQWCCTLGSSILTTRSPLFPWQPRFSTNCGWYPGQVMASSMRASCQAPCWDCRSWAGELPSWIYTWQT